MSCVACHQTNGASLHGRGWTDPSSPNFHGNAIRSANWDMRPCQSCHGALYDGGKVGVSCRECHTNGAGPENCATCHGSANPAPPKDLNGNTSTTAHGVGAHQRHLLGGGSSATYTLVCSECHHVPPSVYSAGHVDSPLPADVLFQGGLSGADPSDVASPAYDSQTFKCNNVFCHGNWNLEKSSSDYPFAYTDSVMRGSNYAPLWTGGSVEVACGTCHGLPPAGHAAADTTGATCGTCHTNPSGQAIVNTSGQIVDKLNHLNGKINVFATQKNF